MYLPLKTITWFQSGINSMGTLHLSARFFHFTVCPNMLTSKFIKFEFVFIVFISVRFNQMIFFITGLEVRSSIVFVFLGSDRLWYRMLYGRNKYWGYVAAYLLEAMFDRTIKVWFHLDFVCWNGLTIRTISVV